MSIWQPDIGPIGKLRDTYSSLPTPVKVGINVLPQTRALKIGRALLHGLETAFVVEDAFRNYQNPASEDQDFQGKIENQNLNKLITPVLLKNNPQVDALWWRKKKKGRTLSIRI